MASSDRGGYLDPSDKNYDKTPDHRSKTPKSLGSKRKRMDPPGRGPSKTGFANMQKMRMDPLTELKQIIAQAGADPVGAGPRNVLPRMLEAQKMREMAAANGLPSAGGAPPVDPTTAAILAKILGTQLPQEELDPSEVEPDDDEDD